MSLESGWFGLVERAAAYMQAIKNKKELMNESLGNDRFNVAADCASQIALFSSQLYEVTFWIDDMSRRMNEDNVPAERLQPSPYWHSAHISVERVIANLYKFRSYSSFCIIVAYLWSLPHCRQWKILAFNMNDHGYFVQVDTGETFGLVYLNGFKMHLLD